MINKFSERDRWRIDNAFQYLEILEPYLLKDLKECKVLDVGCGSGVLSVPISKYVKDVHGIDSDENAIHDSYAFSEEEHCKNVTFNTVSIHDFNEKEEYDIIFMVNSIQYVPDKYLYMKICLDALKEGGVFYLETNNKYFPTPYRMCANRRCRFLSLFELEYLLDSFDVSYRFKMINNPRRFVYRLAKNAVEMFPFLWNFSNAFSIIGIKNIKGKRGINYENVIEKNV